MFSVIKWGGGIRVKNQNWQVKQRNKQPLQNKQKENHTKKPQTQTRNKHWSVAQYTSSSTKGKNHFHRTMEKNATPPVSPTAFQSISVQPSVTYFGLTTIQSLQAHSSYLAHREEILLPNRNKAPQPLRKGASLVLYIAAVLMYQETQPYHCSWVPICTAEILWATALKAQISFPSPSAH